MTPVPSAAKRAALVAGALSDKLSDLERCRSQPGQSLSHGAAGLAVLHTVRANTGLTDARIAHLFIKAAIGEGISAAPAAGLYLGLPAIVFLLHLTAPDDRYAAARATLDTHLQAFARRRADAAFDRIRRGQLTEFGEYDLFYGLTGIAAVLLRTAPGSDALGRTLDYLVALTEPINAHGIQRPGWWVGHSPNRDSSTQFRAGHSNLGTAHGISGPLAVLALALRHGISVDRHYDAIGTICRHLDAHQHTDDTGHHWWPQWITAAPDHTTTTTAQDQPWRPSWCYGTPGIARTQQLAAIATGDISRRHTAEATLLACILDPGQLGRLGDGGLCHGAAGLYQTLARAAADAATSDLAAAVDGLAEVLLDHVENGVGPVEPGLLTGSAGIALALHTAAYPEADAGWDTCLLLN